ncbi:hypothetical protein JL39_20330 [Rhizobium sp. YS-1r]|nr:hypothetical protein JL39_20330 [Rhizobium sp. YS-1r]
MVRPRRLCRRWSPGNGAVLDKAGLFHAVNFSGHGFGPGDVIAEIVVTGRSDFPMEDLLVGRFTSGRRDMSTRNRQVGYLRQISR